MRSLVPRTRQTVELGTIEHQNDREEQGLRCGNLALSTNELLLM
jgi:hypothetical protein